MLGHGAVQEEIRFVINPECIVSRLFTEVLRDQEAVLIHGAERFSAYSGYSGSFRFAGDFVDQTALDSGGRRQTMIVAMDATKYDRGSESRQFGARQCKREANKALVAFQACDSPEVDASDVDEEFGPLQVRPVATGRWGCGVFGGDMLHKALLQAVAATVARRPGMWFHTVGNDQDSATLGALFEAIAERELDVGDVWALLAKFGRRVKKSVAADEPPDFAEFLSDEGLLPPADEPAEET